MMIVQYGSIVLVNVMMFVYHIMTLVECIMMLVVYIMMLVECITMMVADLCAWRFSGTKRTRRNIGTYPPRNTTGTFFSDVLSVDRQWFINVYLLFAGDYGADRVNMGPLL